MTETIITWSEDRGIVTLTIDDPTQTVNTMNSAFVDSFGAALTRLAGMGGALAGV